jgi:aspartokinase-like uncharacterized kinase
VIVVKLGGSLAEGDDLPRWLAALPAGRGRAVVVPGGGVFAETVRAEQRRHGFSDRAAHHMAILAMDQVALMLADRQPSLALCRTADEIRAVLAKRGVPLWLPSVLALADRSIPESWDVTSDSLAAWLAHRLGAPVLALVKPVAAPRSPDAEALAASALVDAAFPRFLADLALEWFGPGDECRLAQRLAA